jgi:hypothetical protein
VKTTTTVCRTTKSTPRSAMFQDCALMEAALVSGADSVRLQDLNDGVGALRSTMGRSCASRYARVHIPNRLLLSLLLQNCISCPAFTSTQAHALPHIHAGPTPTLDSRCTLVLHWCCSTDAKNAGDDPSELGPANGRIVRRVPARAQP